MLWRELEKAEYLKREGVREGERVEIKTSSKSAV